CGAGVVSAWSTAVPTEAVRGPLVLPSRPQQRGRPAAWRGRLGPPCRDTTDSTTDRRSAMSGAAVALRSSDPAMVDAVRSVVALADLPLSVHTAGARPPEAALVLDRAYEERAADQDWRRPGRRVSRYFGSHAERP